MGGGEMVPNKCVGARCRVSPCESTVSISPCGGLGWLVGALELVLCHVPLNPKPIPFQFRVKIGTHVESLKCVSIDAKACSHPSIRDPVNWILAPKWSEPLQIFKFVHVLVLGDIVLLVLLFWRTWKNGDFILVRASEYKVNAMELNIFDRLFETSLMQIENSNLECWSVVGSLALGWTIFPMSLDSVNSCSI
jgi:hypothetical protein